MLNVRDTSELVQPYQSRGSHSTTPTFTCTAGNYVHNNGDAGLALMESFNADVSDNIFENNTYGVRISVGCSHNCFYKNVISDSVK